MTTTPSNLAHGLLSDLGLDFHHIGLACRKIDDDIRQWTALGYSVETAVFEDPAQGIRGVFLTGPGPRLELLEDLPGASSVAPWVKHGTKFYHLGFKINDLKAAMERLEDQGAKTVREPRPSVYFDAALIAFLFLPDGSLIELIEKP